MKRHVLIYGLIGGILIAVLKWTEYRFLVVEHSIEIYGGLTAVTFAVLGIWLGIKLTGKPQQLVVREIPAPVLAPVEEPPIPDGRKRDGLGLTPRELELLECMAQGMRSWTYTDLFEEPGPPTAPFEGGFGLMNPQGIRKPSWFAYKDLHQLGETAVKTAAAQS